MCVTVPNFRLLFATFRVQCPHVRTSKITVRINRFDERSVNCRGIPNSFGRPKNSLAPIVNAAISTYAHALRGPRDHGDRERAGCKRLRMFIFKIRTILRKQCSRVFQVLLFNEML
jgi:hypothetical protein